MSDKKKALSNQSSPESKTAQNKAIQKLDVALKIADFALKLIAIAAKFLEWLG